MGFPSFVFRQIFVHPPQLPPILSLKNQAILITGSNAGIRLEAARQCVKLDASILILAVRNVPKGETAKADILKSNPTSRTQVEVWNLDQESIKSVIAFGKRVQRLPRLDVAILNAAVFKFDWSTSPETSFESSLQINHLSTAILTLYLLPVPGQKICWPNDGGKTTKKMRLRFFQLILSTAEMRRRIEFWNIWTLQF
jgi:NAD(P)-dependent dehydrogenase (short-subunit alcohol dehydrogenase family)